jgi:hypothetical protein
MKLAALNRGLHGVPGAGRKIRTAIVLAVPGSSIGASGRSSADRVVLRQCRIEVHTVATDHDFIRGTDRTCETNASAGADRAAAFAKAAGCQIASEGQPSDLGLDGVEWDSECAECFLGGRFEEDRKLRQAQVDATDEVLERAVHRQNVVVERRPVCVQESVQVGVKSEPIGIQPTRVHLISEAVPGDDIHGRKHGQAVASRKGDPVVGEQPAVDVSVRTRGADSDIPCSDARPLRVVEIRATRQLDICRGAAVGCLVATGWPVEDDTVETGGWGAIDAWRVTIRRRLWPG